jgi:mono/diheme cytochrome c family protein
MTANPTPSIATPAIAPQAPRGEIRRATKALLAWAAVGCTFAWLCWPASPIPVREEATPVRLNDPATIERGRYLSVLGNCQACHTQRGGQAFAGGQGIATPFGMVYGSNLTPSPSGLGAWTAADFWRSLHHGQAPDGRWLNPAFPYTNTTHITRTDSDALFAYFRSLPAANTPNTPSEVRWPFNTQAAQRAWRALYFRSSENQQATTTPADSAVDRSASGASSALQRGAYLVNGPAHCSACHVPRNALGGSSDMLSLSGGLIPVQNWYAPSLLDPAEAGVQDWPLQDIVALFQNGRSRDHLVTGPMAEVVLHSTQHWREGDLLAMATYLKQLPRQSVPATAPSSPANGISVARGAKLYKEQCIACHGKQGEGVQLPDGAWAYPPLAGNATVRQSSPANLIQSVLRGGFAPSTAAHPRPFGMPPFVVEFDNVELADLLSYIRITWGQGAGQVSALDVQKLRETPFH